MEQPENGEPAAYPQDPREAMARRERLDRRSKAGHSAAANEGGGASTRWP
jgi:hypothetical protein